MKKPKIFISTPEIRTKIAKENIKKIKEKIFNNLIEERKIKQEREGLFKDIEHLKLLIVEDKDIKRIRKTEQGGSK